ncbi:hypothetical protein HY857_02560 [Candidatus Saccharibacteria bacterium]|nr:hypothetical protein [Candidatus Saccharibacteria bacterium]
MTVIVVVIFLIALGTVCVGSLIGAYFSRNDMTEHRYVVVNEAYWWIVASIEATDDPQQVASLATIRTKLEAEVDKANRKFDRQKLPDRTTSLA